MRHGKAVPAAVANGGDIFWAPRPLLRMFARC
jgi:hypothetical protein